MGTVIRRRQEIFVHLVWSTWDRAPILDAAVPAWLWPMLGEEARRLGCAWSVAGGVEDHVHLLCAVPTTIAVAHLAQQVKGASARCAAERGVGLKWQAGYGAFSVSPDHVATVEAYVRAQAMHHATGRELAAWE